MKIVAGFYTSPDGLSHRHMYAVDAGGDSSPAVTATLVDFVCDLHPPADAIFIDLLSRQCAGSYVPNDPGQADFSVNQKYVWVRPPIAAPGRIVISNEYVPEYSMDDGVPQSFAMESFFSVLEHWRGFLRLSESDGGQVLELNV
ncbi:MAG: hypothetical protein JF591_07135 [Lysobacter sp.]|nr:hypothetical protein [Lysobacter sp.]